MQWLWRPHYSLIALPDCDKIKWRHTPIPCANTHTTNHAILNWCATPAWKALAPPPDPWLVPIRICTRLATDPRLADSITMRECICETWHGVTESVKRTPPQCTTTRYRRGIVCMRDQTPDGSAVQSSNLLIAYCSLCFLIACVSVAVGPDSPRTQCSPDSLT